MNLFRGKFFKDFVNTGMTNTASVVFSFFRTMLMVRMVGSEDYGRYQYLFSYIVLTDFFCTNLDIVIKRYFSDRQEIRSEILSANIVTKLILFFSSAVLVGAYLNWRDHDFFNSDWSAISAFILIRIFIGLFKNSYGSALQSIRQYQLVNYVEILTNFALLLILVTLSLGLGMQEITLLYWFNLLWILTMLVGLFATYREFVKQIGKVHFFLSLRVFNVGIWQQRNYFLPLVGTSFSGYIKLYLPSLLLGETLQFKEVTYYEVVKKIFGVFYKQIPSILTTLMPSLARAQQHPEKFNEKWSAAMLLYFLGSFGFSLFMFFFGPLIFHFYGLQWTKDIQNLVFIFSIGLLLGCWIQANQTLILSSNSTFLIFISSIGRQLFFMTFIWYYYASLNPVILAIGVNSMHFVTILLYVYQAYIANRKSFYLQGRYALWTILMSAGIYFVHTKMEPLVLF